MGYGIDPLEGDLQLLLVEEVDADVRRIVDMLAEELRSAQVMVVSAATNPRPSSGWVANALGAKVRSYHLILPPGGDGFVWAMSGLDLPGVTRRLALVNKALAEGPEPVLVRFGLAQLWPGDSPKDLVERASAALHLSSP